MKQTQLIFAFILIFGFGVKAQEAKRIVSLVPWITKSIHLMDEQSRLVGRSNYCPTDASDKSQVVATAVSVNIEKVLSLKPDLIFASSLIKPETIDKLTKLGLKVVNMPYPKSFDEICSDFIKIGGFVGHEAKAKGIISQQKARLAKVQNRIPTATKPKIFIQIGAKPLFCAIPNTFMNDFITYSGGENIAAELTSGSIIREYVLKQNPDVIFIVTMGLVADEERATWMSYSSLAAAKSKRIYVLDSDKTCSPTPILFVDALEEMVGLIYEQKR